MRALLQASQPRFFGFIFGFSVFVASIQLEPTSATEIEPTSATEIEPNTRTPNTRTRTHVPEHTFPNTRSFEHLFAYNASSPSPIFGSKVEALIFRIEVSRNRTKKRAAQTMQRREKIKLNFYFLIPPFLGVRKTSPNW